MNEPRNAQFWLIVAAAAALTALAASVTLRTAPRFFYTLTIPK
jgi:hypothetical protein